jgi:D-serine deaminase-like pyridoxal phosphate-dependent protein
MMTSKWELETPALVVDRDIMMRNIAWMQQKADQAGVKLRPHTKTHRTPALAHLQMQAGAAGITVAKVGEAEVMAAHGLRDILIANQIFGQSKVERLRRVNRIARVAVGCDNPEQVQALSAAFAGEPRPLSVRIEVEVGEQRSGVLPGQQLVSLAKLISEQPGLLLEGVFSHEGHTYGATSQQECMELFEQSQRDTLQAAELIRQAGIPCPAVSIGATPSLLLGTILPGVTEVRPGTYILMDAAQGSAIQDYSRCAASVLATVISKPVPHRVVLDTGVKALTSFTRDKGICFTPGYGLVKRFGERIYKLYDEHALLQSERAYQELQIGDKLEIIPNHICPTCNLYDRMYLLEGESVIAELSIACRGKSQ